MNKFKLKHTRKNHKNKKKKTMKNTNKVTNIWNTDWTKKDVKYPKRKHLKLKELDSIPYVNENGEPVSIKEEREEQYVANDYINPNNTVLELGARY